MDADEYVQSATNQANAIIQEIDNGDFSTITERIDSAEVVRSAFKEMEKSGCDFKSAKSELIGHKVTHYVRNYSEIKIAYEKDLICKNLLIVFYFDITKIFQPKLIEIQDYERKESLMNEMTKPNNVQPPAELK